MDSQKEEEKARYDHRSRRRSSTDMVHCNITDAPGHRDVS